MVNKIFKCLIRFLIEVIVMTVLIVGINIFMNGMYLWGLPRILPSACMDTDQVENALDRNDTRNCRIDNDVHKQLCPLSQF